MIAAGEVVQRPASVVKELMENAVDAGAGAISVSVTDSGRTMISVSDNGCGMDPDQAVLCFERHATSKLQTAEDLHNILTFGFRGEALASIAAVSEVSLKTRKENEETGCEVEFANSKHISTKVISAPKGSTFTVRNLFYNVPARRKFLKSDNVEFRHIAEEFTRVALSRTDISFSLFHNDKEIFMTRASNSLKYRISDLLGKSVSNRLKEIDTETSVVKLSGFMEIPEMTKKTSSCQYLFVNGRFFKSGYIHKAIVTGYGDMIPPGTVPSYVLFLQINPGEVDINIHPSKTEVKFEDESLLFQLICASVKEFLGKYSNSVKIDFEQNINEIPVFGADYDKFRPVVRPPEITVNNDFNPFETNSGNRNEQYNANHQSRRYFDKEPKQNYGKLFEDNLINSVSMLIIQSKFIVTYAASGMLVINISRARERILFEKFLDAVMKETKIALNLLFPITLNFGKKEMSIISDHEDFLADIGFVLTPKDEETVEMHSHPQGFPNNADILENLLRDIINLLDEEKELAEDLLSNKIAERLAEIGVRKLPPLTSPAEAQNLIDSLFACKNAEYTHRGKNIMKIINTDELEKSF